MAITQRIIEISETGECRDSLDQRLTNLILSLNILPVPIPNTLGSNQGAKNGPSPLKNWLQKVNPAGIILSGGEDLGRYSIRDELEFEILNWAQGEIRPVLGICRGMQVMAAWAGVGLVEISNHVGIRHQVTGEISQEVNSFHNFTLDKCPKTFRELAQSVDGTIEAIRHREIPWEGWMWHPEREVPYSHIDISRIKSLFREN